jgi:hypothetical protein
MGSTQNLKCIRLPFRCQGVQLPSHVLHSWWHWFGTLVSMHRSESTGWQR